jgi:hypothetical protein
MSTSSFQKIPKSLIAEIDACDGKAFKIFTVIKLRPGDKLPNLPGLDLSRVPAVIPDETLPDPKKGAWARRNTSEWEIVRKDLAKYTKSFSHESPNFGDWSKGSHEITVDREVYPRDVFPGYGTTILMKRLDESQDTISLHLELNRTFEQRPSDDRELLFAINLFQESVGSTHIRSVDTPAQSYLSTLRVQWEILPKGTKEETMVAIRSRFNPTPEENRIIEERLDLLYALRPENLIAGTSGFARYIGAQYGPDLVAFDNIRYGNALYIMFSDWERLSKMSRVELQNSDEKFERIIHKQGWERVVRAIISEYRSSYGSLF